MRRSRDLNPGCDHSHYSLSRGAPSATWVLLHVKAGGARGIRTPGTFRYHWFSRPAPSTARPSLQVQPATNILSWVLLSVKDFFVSFRPYCPGFRDQTQRKTVQKFEKYAQNSQLTPFQGTAYLLVSGDKKPERKKKTKRKK